MRNAIGIAVFFGMLGVTAFGLVLTPVFYVLLRKLAGGGTLVEKHRRVPQIQEEESTHVVPGYDDHPYPS